MSTGDKRLDSALADFATLPGMGPVMALNAGAMAAQGVTPGEIAKFLRGMDLVLSGMRTEALMFILLRDFDCIEAGHALQRMHELQLCLIDFFKHIGEVTLVDGHLQAALQSAGQIRRSIETVNALVNALELKGAAVAAAAMRRAGGEP